MGASQDVSSLLATGNVMVGSFGQSCEARSSIGGVQGVHWLVSSEGEMGIRNELPSSLSLVLGGERASYKCSRDEGGSARFECFPSQDSGRVSSFLSDSGKVVTSVKKQRSMTSV